MNNNILDELQIQEWLDSIDGVIDCESNQAAKFIIETIAKRLKERSKLDVLNQATTDYINTIKIDEEVAYAGNKEIENKIAALVRWNATMMVLKANKKNGELGGHIASYASSSSLYEVGFNHFWQANNQNQCGDIIFFQGHSSPGIYARSFLEDRFTEEKLLNFRQEAFTDGLSSYPHPWLMPDYWQIPTVSMGLGPLMAIYQARFMKYLHDRELADTSKRKIWCFVGDGETSEPETLGNIHIAGREKLNNLIFVINCNLQRLDGPVNGNGKIIQELEGLFHGASWLVIKIIWGKGWDTLLSKDNSGKLKQLMMETVDGEYQTYRTKNGGFIREKFFGKYPETLAMVEDISDEDIWALTRGGHDLDKIYNAYYQAVNSEHNKPIVILAKTIKGFGMQGEGESQNTAHQQKKLSIDTLKKICQKFAINLTEEEIITLPFIKLDKNSAEYKYLHQQRIQLGGYYPNRTVTNSKFILPHIDSFINLTLDTKERLVSTTMIFVRILNILLKDKNIGKLIVPIVPDESRTFGMEGMFRQLGIWSHCGQNYTPEDSNQLMFYKEDVKGQILQEGINEAGAVSSWIAAATSYANHGITMIPFYIYYSMFGFQRIGDLLWAAGDMRARGFLIGATSGRTTLNGEGLQHEDGHSHIQASVIPNCVSYDPTFSYELMHIINHGLHEMYVKNQDKFYYITVMNENYRHYKMPDNSKDNIISGCYLFSSTKIDSKLSVNLLGSGAIFNEIIAASELLLNDFNINSNLFSVTSFNQLYRDGIDNDRFNMLHPTESQKIPFITKLLSPYDAKVTVASTDYIRAFANQIRAYVPHEYIVLGTDGFGRSDSRSALRQFFEINRFYIVLAALYGLSKEGLISNTIPQEAIMKYNINHLIDNPWDI